MAKTYTVELTEEQMRQLGLEIDPFERADEGEYYYYASSQGIAYHEKDLDYCRDNERYNAGNYCTDEDIMRQRVLHETLHRQLWRFSMQNGGGELNWEDTIARWCVYLYPPHKSEKYLVCNNYGQSVGAVYFMSKELAEQAIEQIVKPFITEHPEFEFEGCCL